MTVETFPSGSMTLDMALGGGYPKGRVIEIYGPESSGKTTLALHAAAEIQKQGGTLPRRPLSPGASALNARSESAAVTPI